jgi:UDP-N-acetylmuramoyl-L-alanyl-D-glutamate--2,6-diaminopimelate ligase
MTFGLADEADVRASDVTYGAEGTDLTLELEGSRHRCRLPLVGAFNVSNALGAVATARALDVATDTVVERLAGAPQVPGRVERLAAMDGWVVLRDYAHTPDALSRLLEALRPLVTGRLIALFGCGGDRDRTKRPVMGKIAARAADVVIVTSDNPRTEDPERILDEIEAGMAGTAHLRVVDRREAIQRALGMLEAGDCLVLAGKGHETYQIVGAERRPFDERVIVHDALGLSAA